MDKRVLSREVRLQAALERLGSNNPHCAICNEGTPFCLERHHIGGRAHDGVTAILCRNCHRKQTEMQKEHPVAKPGSDPLLAAIAAVLFGLADILDAVKDRLPDGLEALCETVVPWLYQAGEFLLERAQPVTTAPIGPIAS